MGIFETYCREYERLLQDPCELKSACFTGHRVLPSKDIPAIRMLLRQSILEACQLGFTVFYCGAALGFDLLAGEEVINLRNTHPYLQLKLVIPCPDQNRYWPETEKKRWDDLIRKASDVKQNSNFYYAGCMQARNRYMVDNSKLCICYQENFSGGTFSTVRYAQRLNVPVLNLCIPFMKMKACDPGSSLRLRESDHYGIIHSHSLLRPEMPLLRLRLIPWEIRSLGAVYCHAAFGSRTTFCRSSRVLPNRRNCVYRRRHSFPSSAGSAGSPD